MSHTESRRANHRRHSSVDSEDEGVSPADYIPTPPDGGWGWVIVAASLVCNVIVDGIGYSFGILLTALVENFNTTKSKASLVGSLLCGVYLCAGPIVSGLVNKFGCRPVTIAGSILACVAFLLSTLSPSIEILALTYGAIGGFGFGLIYLPSIVGVGYYFETKRALATGIAVCGSGIGTFVFAPLVSYLLEIYAWKNTLYILAGIVLNAAVCGMLMRPLQAPKPRKQIQNGRKRKRHRRKAARDRCNSENDVNGENTNVILEKVREAKLEREKALQDNDSDIGSLPSSIFVKGLSRADSKTESRVRQVSEPGSMISRQVSGSEKGDNVSSHAGSPDSVPKIVIGDSDSQDKESITKLASDDIELKHIESNKGSKSAPETPIGDAMSPEEMAALLGRQSVHNSLPRKIAKDNENSAPNGYMSGDQRCITSPDGNIMIIQKKEKPKDTHMHTLEDRAHLLTTGDRYQLVVPKEDYARPMYRKDIFYSGSVLNIPQFRSQPDMRSYITSVTTIPDGNFDGEVDCWCWDYVCLPKSAKDTCKEMLDLSLLTNPSFIFICLGNVLAFLGFLIPFVYTVDRAKHLGIDPGKASFLLSVIGITNTVGRIISGFLADFGKVSSLTINNIALLISGAATMLAPFCLTYPWMVVYTSVFGFCIAAFISLTSIILCDLLGLEKLTNAFGLLTLTRGVSAIAGPPLTGYIFDVTDSHDLSFFIGGAFIICGGLLHCVLHLPYFKKPVEVISCEVEALQSLSTEEIFARGDKPNAV